MTLSLLGDPPSSEISHTREVTQGASFSNPWYLQQELTFVAQVGVSDIKRQLACSQTMSCSKYLIPVKLIPTSTSTTLHGNGTYWRMYAEGGDKSYLSHHTVSISQFSAHTKLLSGRISVSGQPFPLLFLAAISIQALGQKVKTTSLPHLGTPVVYLGSGSR